MAALDLVVTRLGDADGRWQLAVHGVAPQAVRIANAARVVDLHLLIADAVLALEHDEPELALRILRGARADAMPKRGVSPGHGAAALPVS